MDNLAFFQSIFASVILPLSTALESGIGPLVEAARPLALALAVLWVATEGVKLAYGAASVNGSIGEWLKTVGFIGLLASTAIYMQFISNLFLHVIPDGFTSMIGAGASPAAGLDHILNSALSRAIDTYNSIGWLSMGAIPLGIGIIVFMAIAVAAVGFTFFCYIISVITVVTAIYIGPIFVALAALPATRKYAAGWLSVVVGAVVAQCLSLAILMLLSAAEGTALATDAASYATTGNGLIMFMGLLRLGLLLVLCAAIILRTPAMAYAIAGGVYSSTSTAAAATFGAAASAGKGLLSVAGNTAAAVGANAGKQIGAGAIRRAAPVGKSLSKA